MYVELDGSRHGGLVASKVFLIIYFWYSRRAVLPICAVQKCEFVQVSMGGDPHLQKKVEGTLPLPHSIPFP